MNKIISYGWGTDLPIGLFVHTIHEKILENISAKFKNVLLVDTTWLGTDNIKSVYSQIEKNDVDVIVLCSFVDATFITEDDFAQYNIKIISIGNFNKNNRVDFWSMIIERTNRNQNTTLQTVEYPFICYNNKPHLHRVQLRNAFEKLDLIGKGAISFGGDNPIPSPEDKDKIAFEESGAGNSLLNDTTTLGDIDIWNVSFINIVTETEYNPVERCFYSEKTWKPIIGMRPFLHYTSDNVNKELNEFGFQTFEKCFTDICDLDLTAYKNIALFCKILTEQNSLYFNKKYKELEPKLKHNYTNFFKFVSNQHERIANIYI